MAGKQQQLQIQQQQAQQQLAHGGQVHQQKLAHGGQVHNQKLTHAEIAARQQAQMRAAQAAKPQTTKKPSGDKDE